MACVAGWWDLPCFSLLGRTPECGETPDWGWGQGAADVCKGELPSQFVPGWLNLCILDFQVLSTIYPLVWFHEFLVKIAKYISAHLYWWKWSLSSLLEANPSKRANPQFLEVELMTLLSVIKPTKVKSLSSFKFSLKEKLQNAGKTVLQLDPLQCTCGWMLYSLISLDANILSCTCCIVSYHAIMQEPLKCEVHAYMILQLPTSCGTLRR